MLMVVSPTRSSSRGDVRVRPRPLNSLGDVRDRGGRTTEYVLKGIFRRPLRNLASISHHQQRVWLYPPGIDDPENGEYRQRHDDDHHDQDYLSNSRHSHPPRNARKGPPSA